MTVMTVTLSWTSTSLRLLVRRTPRRLFPTLVAMSRFPVPYPSHLGCRVVVSLLPFAHMWCMVSLEPFGTCVA
jgi:hypothetical protein